MDSINQQYERLGITPLQADVLIALMENGGSASVPEIISTLTVNQKVNRTSIYSVLKKLVNLNLVLSSDHPESRNITYTLVSKSPQELINILNETHTTAVSDLTNKLQEAKLIASKSRIETEFYSLKNLDQIKRQIRTVIIESNDYLLIMANSLMLKQIYPLIEEKVNNSPEIEILVQPTWNPDPDLDFDNLLKEFKSLLGNDCVSDPLRIFSAMGELSKSKVMEFSKIASKENLDMPSIISKTHFIQVLTEQGIIMSTFFDHDLLQSLGGSGLYSKEQFILQNYIIIFFSIFKDHHTDFNSDIMERIMIKRRKDWFGTIQTLLSG
ncbi:MAG: hypothetical protein GPJ54_07990 [Candidatus Heimdallarchaeota archaeon]|nr:hypothetical protein [Candidatus Heimdallarchaeota archaeon]